MTEHLFNLVEKTKLGIGDIFEAADNQVQRTPYGHMRYAIKYRAFFIYWVRRSLITRYRQTSLGWLWALLQPLISSLIFFIVFAIVLQVDTKPVPYDLFIITDMVFWSYFSRVVVIGSVSVTGNLELLSRIRFPREFLPLAVWVESVVDLLLGLGIVAVAFAIHHYPLTPFALYAIPTLLVETMLALGLAFLLAALTVIIRDLMQIVPLVMQLVIYLSPVIYPLVKVPDSIKALYVINPLGPIFASYQQALFNPLANIPLNIQKLYLGQLGPIFLTHQLNRFYSQFSLSRELLITALFSAALLIGSYTLFKRLEWQFADLL